MVEGGLKLQQGKIARPTVLTGHNDVTSYGQCQSDIESGKVVYKSQFRYMVTVTKKYLNFPC